MENKNRIIREAFAQLQSGKAEVRTGEDEKYIRYMGAVHHENGSLIGYCSRPEAKPST